MSKWSDKIPGLNDAIQKPFGDEFKATLEDHGGAVLDDLRDSLAMRLHGELCDGRHDDQDGPCWTAWRPEADLLMPDIRRELAKAWANGARKGAVWLSATERDRHNPYIPHGSLCGCAFCYSAAMVGGR